jgi:uncharacterized protein
MSVLAVLLAIIVGVTLGLLGGGGSILTVPAIVYALGVEPKTAIVMGLPIVGGAALIGVVQHWRLGNIRFSIAIPFGIAAMLGAFGGALLARHLTGTTQLLVLAVVMLAASFSMYRNAALPEHVIGRTEHPRPLVFVVGITAGMLTGLVGVGGGFLLVPALVILAGVPMRQAVGTSLFVIVLNTAAGYAGYHGVVDVPWDLVLWFAGFTGAGILVGTALVRHVPQPMLKRAFAMLLVVVAGLILFQNRATYL